MAAISIERLAKDFAAYSRSSRLVVLCLVAVPTLIGIAWIIFLAGCGPVPQRISITDPEIQQLFKAAQSFPRADYGFSPLPSSAATDIRIERRSEGDYNIMLHIYTDTRRTIAFRAKGGANVWIREQESFPGPNMYEGIDGPSREQITLTYGTENATGDATGNPTDQLSINYRGEDSRLRGNRDLSLEEVRPILVEWGYKK